jgi:phosphoglycolate phosphatase
MHPDDDIQAWLVDLDGTLVDTLGDFVAALGQVAEQLGRTPPTRDWVRCAIGRGGERLLRDALRHWNLPDTDLEPARSLFQAAYADANGRHARAFDGLAQGLAALSSWPLACVTNKPQALAEDLLERLQLRDAFRVVIGQRPGLRPKPHPDALLEAARRLGVAPDRCAVLGDSRNDAEAAQAAGCASVLLFRHGYNHGEAVDAVPAQAHLDDWPALTRWLSDLSCRATGS